MASLRIGLVYDLLGSFPARQGDPPDMDVEYEPEATVELLERALRALGHVPTRLGGPADLLSTIGKGQLPPIDCALNIAEGTRGRDREAWAPVLLQLAGVPTLGSDALTLSATLDKAWATRLVAATGVPVPFQAVTGSRSDVENTDWTGRFPLFVKPRWEGTAKGIRASSRVANVAALAAEVERVVRDYDQPALVEELLPGAEYTVTVVGHAPPRALPVLQRALDAQTGIGIHAIEGELTPERVAQAVTPGELSPELEAQLAALALQAYAALECLDFARADFKLDAEGGARFLEMNPLPTFAPDASFGILAELAGRPTHQLLADVLGEGLVRLGLA